MFKRCGFVNVDYLVKNKIYAEPSKILNILNRDWRKWVKPVCMFDGGGLDPFDPNFGNENAGASWYSVLVNRMIGSPFTSPADVGTANSITFRGRADVGTVNVKAVLVKASDLTIVTNGIGNPVSCPTTLAWYTSTFATPPTLTPNISYVLMLIPDATFRFYYDYVAYTSKQDTTNSYASPTNPTDAGNIADFKGSIYCSYTTLAKPLVTHVRIR